MSDLHIEINDGIVSPLSYINPKAKILILAGDIGRINKYEQLRLFLEDVCKHFELVFYVLGNHEYYNVEKIPKLFMDELLTRLETIRKNIPNLHILNRSSVVIGNVCVVGCTLWSKADYVPPYVVRIHGMNKTKYNTLHKQDVQYIEKMIDYCRIQKLKLLVITHHCPTHDVSRSVLQEESESGEKNIGDRYKNLYTTDLDRLLQSTKIHTWICGHNHKNFDYITTGGTRLVSNQKGKPDNNITDFSKEKIIVV